MLLVITRPPPLSIAESVIWQPFVRFVAVEAITLVQIVFPAQSVIDFLLVEYVKYLAAESVRLVNVNVQSVVFEYVTLTLLAPASRKPMLVPTP